jgi:penicillin-binding protein 2
MTAPQPTQNQIEGWRIAAFTAVVITIFLLFMVRMFNLQIVQGAGYLDEAVENYTSTINIAAPRGNITDRNGITLAENIPSYNIVITAAELPEDDVDIEDVYRKLSEIIDVPVDLNEISPETPFSPCISEHGIRQIATFGETTAPFTPIEILCDVDKMLAMMVLERAADLPGVGVDIETVRDYPTGSLTSQIIGYLGPIPATREQFFVEQGFIPNRDRIGYDGIEFIFQDELSGQNGLRTVERDVAGQVIRDLAPPREPEPGYNIQLSIDMRLQEATDAIVKQELTFWNTYLNRIQSNNAVAIAMNPQTGEILSIVSIPTYENNRFARQIPGYYYVQLAEDPLRPLFNHAVAAEHPPGSVFKIATAIGALNENIVTEDQLVQTPGTITLQEKFFTADPGNQREFVDWNRAGFGQLNFTGGIANSSNVYFYKIGGGYFDEIPDGGLGVCRLQTYARALGYGDPTGIELAADADGLLPTPRWKRITKGENWSTGDTYIASVGQGFVLSSPLQVLLSAAAVANDGKLMNPTLVRGITDGDGNPINEVYDPNGDVYWSTGPDLRWDATVEPVITEYTQYVSGSGGCQETGNSKTIRPDVFDAMQNGMRQAVLRGTLEDEFANFPIAAAGKTGTAEYCDNFAQAQNRCIPGNWPTHAWTVAYAPYENPEIAVVAFVYNGGEGASVAGPIVRKVMQAYFELKAVDSALDTP